MVYFRRASESTSTKTVATKLLRSIEQEALPPTTFGMFLASANPPCPIVNILGQQLRNTSDMWPWVCYEGCELGSDLGRS